MKVPVDLLLSVLWGVGRALYCTMWIQWHICHIQTGKKARDAELELGALGDVESLLPGLAPEV